MFHRRLLELAPGLPPTRPGPINVFHNRLEASPRPLIAGLTEMRVPLCEMFIAALLEKEMGETGHLGESASFGDDGFWVRTSWIGLFL